MKNYSSRSVPSFETVSALSWNQRYWKCVSLLFHFGLWLTLVMPGTDGLSGAERAERMSAHELDSKATRVFVPRPNKDKDSKDQFSPNGPIDSPQANGAADVTVNLKGIQLGIVNDPAFQLTRVLQREDGLIGCATVTTPRLLELVFPIGNDGDSTADRTWSSYFPLKFRRFREELPSAYQRCVNSGLGSDVIGYALFPRRFEKNLETAIRTEAVKRGMAGIVTRAEIRFNLESAAGFLVEDVEVEEPAPLQLTGSGS